MSCKRRLILGLFSICIIWTNAGVLTNAASFPALLAFGDSILDTGNNNFLLTLMKANIWPYGRSMRLRFPTGRFGNGRVFSDVVAEGLGIKKELPAYRKMFISPMDLRSGVCFASGGAGVDPVTSRMLRVLSPSQQISDFKGYIRRLKLTAGPARANQIIANAVILVSQGNNDIGISFFSTPAARARGMWTSRTYTNRLTAWNKAFIKSIYDQGARKFAIMGTIPLGCMPMTRVFGNWCNFFANRVAEEYNGKLRSGTKTWASEMSGAKFVYVDMFNSLMDVMNNYRRYGFINAKRGCCCQIRSIIPCPIPNRYVWYDFVHPSERAYQIISKKLVQDMKTGLA